MFHSELRNATGRLPVEVEEGLWDLVARGHRHRRRVPGRALAALGTPERGSGASATSSGCALGARRAPTLARGGRGTLGAAAHVPARRATTIRPGDAGRAGGRAAAGPLGRGLLGPHGAREPGPAVARGGVGAAAARGTRPRARRPLRHRLRPASSTRCPRPSTSCGGSGAASAHGADRAAQRGRPAQPGGHRPARRTRHGGADQLGHLPRRRCPWPTTATRRHARCDPAGLVDSTPA